MQASITVQYACDSRRGLPAATRFHQWARSALQQPGNLSIRLVETAEMAELNSLYRDKPAATNVLSFPSDEQVREQHSWLGDVVLCVPVARQQSQSQQKPLANHLAHLTIHGVLHLQGFDHIQEQDAQQMEALEIQLLKQAGITNPYV